MARRVLPTPLPALHPLPVGATDRGGVVEAPADVGAAVRFARTRAGYTLEQFATATGHSRTTVQQVETAPDGTSLAVLLNVLHAAGLTLALIPRDPTVSLRPADDAA